MAVTDSAGTGVKTLTSTQKDKSTAWVGQKDYDDTVGFITVGKTTAIRTTPFFPLITPKIITFNIGSAVYQGIEGITWERWVASAWNTGGFTVSGSTILASDGSTVSGQTPTTVINGGAVYH